MPQANSENSTPMPAVSTRRRFLSASVAAGGTVLALATIPPASAAAAPATPLDPVFGLIAAHKQIVGTVDGIAAEINRAVEIDEQTALEKGALSEQCSVEMGLFLDLLEIVPTTLAGVVALVTYLDEVNKKDPWKFEDNYATPLIGTLATAFNRMAVQFATPTTRARPPVHAGRFFF